RGLSCHFSGAEAQALRLLEAGAPQEEIAAEVFDCVARTAARLLVNASEGTGLTDALLGGGVASSALLRERIRGRVRKRRRGLRLHFARPELAGDNAVGAAFLGAERGER
ncbi:MAG: O-sialoglycoprotein endopeptidase, partial [Firmicutes bacterium]|nr:O-sialoglycoprotein endopeptidase [Bacillota bacterium]